MIEEYSSLDFLHVLSNEFSSASTPSSNAWNFALATSRLENSTIEIKTYAAMLRPNGSVGAEILARYISGGSDPSRYTTHWIQVIETNHRAGNTHGRWRSYVDVPDGSLTPYYDDSYAINGQVLYDLSHRSDRLSKHSWEAKTFLAVGPADGVSGEVTILYPGFRWGWTNECFASPPWIDSDR